MENKHHTLLLVGEGQVSHLHLSFTLIFALPWSSLGTPGSHCCPQGVLGSLASALAVEAAFSFSLVLYIFMNRNVKANGEEKQVLMEELEGRRELFVSLRDLTFQW